MKKVALSSLSVVVLMLGLHSTALAQGNLQQQVKALQVAVAALKTSNAKLVATVAALQTSNAQLGASVTTLQSGLSAMQSNTVLSLNGKLSLLSDGVTALFSGVNLQIVNGSGLTTTVNGTGNLIVGYNESFNPGGNFRIVCANGAYPDRISCENAGETWDSHQTTGSHNVVIGMGHTYTQTGGLVAGFSNAINSPGASVTGGELNVASGTDASSVSGGYYNTASGAVSSVSGGFVGTASGVVSSVSGGNNSIASGDESSVSGGLHRTAPNVFNWAGGSLLEQQ